MKKLVTIFLLLVITGSVESVTIKEQTPFFTTTQPVSGGGGGGNSFAFITSSSGLSGTANSVTTGAVDTTGATLFDVCVTSVVACTVSDNNSQSYTAATAQTTGGWIVQHFYLLSGSGKVGHTFTATGVNSFAAISMECFTCTGGTPSVDNQNGNVSAVGSSIQGTTSVSSSTGQRVVVSGFTSKATGSTYGIDSGMTATVSSKNGSVAILQAYLVQSVGAAINPTVTLTGGAEQFLCIAGIAFK